MEFKNPLVTYVGMIIAIFAMLSGVFNWVVSPEIAWSIAGIFGFGSVASLRAYIKSEGWMTYTVTGIPMILGVLTAFNVINLELYQTLLAVFAPLTGITLQNAQTKVK